jgi:hypothetical protein
LDHGKTKSGGRLSFVAWEVNRDKFYLLTAMPPSEERVRLYEKLKKKPQL